MMQQWPGRNARLDPKSDDELRRLVEKGVKKGKSDYEDWESLEKRDPGK
jgi:hypothetical protein